MANSEYDQVYEDTPFTVKIKEGEHCLKLACCDCGLIHRFFIDIVAGDEIMIRVERDNRATGQLRRWHEQLKK